jgi:hypothetical protein
MLLLKSMQREYMLRLTVNSRKLSRVLIDSHYEIKHSGSINDAIVLELVKKLNGGTFEHDKVTKAGWEIYSNDPWYLDGKPYRIIWCLHPGETYLGVINVFRRSDAKFSK